MESHIKAIGIIYIVLSGLSLLGGAAIFLLMAFAGAVSGEDGGALLGGLIGTFLGGLVMVLSIPGVVGGIYLLKYRPWARILIIVLACINLLSIPIGTAIGIYTLVILFKPETQALFSDGASAA